MLPSVESMMVETFGERAVEILRRISPVGVWKIDRPV